jgi:2-keto-4-pentenoate hydratase/2-oxohepta-3-ene-1,7-dioic acid hydratase in catechol pathway
MRLGVVQPASGPHLARIDAETTRTFASGDCLAPIIAQGDSSVSVSAAAAPVGKFDYLPPIRSGRFFCIGLNYQAHVAEVARDASERPSVFTRTAASLVGHGQALWHPSVSREQDYEGELGVVVGRAGRHVSAATAMDHVFGYTCFNDGSVRDFQKHSVTAGKNFERSGAIGPWIVTADEAPAWNEMSLTTRINGETAQSTTTDRMIYGVPELIAYISSFTTLLPGDVIATGTPAGVGARRKPPLWLKPGDEVEVEISGIGTLKNPVKQEPS